MSLAKSNLKIDFPFASWDQELLFNVYLVIEKTWKNKICKKPNLLNESEDQITEWLQDELERILVSGSDDTFNRRKFQSVIRGGHACSYNKNSLNKQPDLTLKLVDIRPGIDDSRYDALFIECKLLDKDSMTQLKYIKNGIRRFVDGEYAWAMPHGMMLGFVRDENIYISSLDQCFNRNIKTEIISRCAPLRKIKDGKTINPNTYFSIHPRSWVHSDYGSPGPVKIDHVWLYIKI